jgi:hypothetical protein
MNLSKNKLLIVVGLVIILGIILVITRLNIEKKTETTFKIENPPEKVINPALLNILKPENFPMIKSIGISKDEIFIDKDGFENQNYFYISETNQENVLAEYKNYFKANNWIIKQPTSTNPFIIEAKKDNLVLIINISKDNLFNKTLVGITIKDVGKQYEFSFPKEIKFLYSKTPIQISYKKDNFGFNRIEAAYESYSNNNTLSKIYFNDLKSLKWNPKEIKTEIVSKKFIESYSTSSQLFVDIDNVLFDQQKGLFKTMVKLIYLYK